MQSPIIDALIGATSATVGGVISYSSLYPLENIRTRLQVARKVGSTHSTGGHDAEPVKPQQSALSLICNIYREQGIDAFYGGLGSGIFGIAVSNSVYFYWYSFLKQWVIRYRRFFNKRYGSSLSTVDNIIVAALAGCINITITNPIWVVNTRMMLQTQQKAFHHTTTHLSKVAHGVHQAKAQLEDAVIDTANTMVKRVEASVESQSTDGNTHNSNVTPGASPQCDLDSILHESTSELKQKVTTIVGSISPSNEINGLTNAIGKDIEANSQSIASVCRRAMARILEYMKHSPEYLTTYLKQVYALLQTIYFLVKQKIMRSLGMTTPQEVPHALPDADDDPFYYHSLIDGLTKMLHLEGFSSLYKGYWASIVLVMNPTIQFVLYDQIVAWALKRKGARSGQQPTTHLSSWQYFCISALTKAIATVATYPYQVIKSRQQQIEKSFAADEHHQARRGKSLSIYETMIKMKNEEGYQVFINGLGAKLLQTVSNAALTSMIQERIHRGISEALLPLLVHGGSK